MTSYLILSCLFHHHVSPPHLCVLYSFFSLYTTILTVDRKRKTEKKETQRHDRWNMGEREAKEVVAECTRI